ncbi:MAG: hypothetical protein ACYSU0_22885 [Planctomycetota bacterium]|jgi:hypothetical protein
MRKQVVLATTVVVFLVGMLLPPTVSTRPPRPEVGTVLGVLFFLERPALRLGLEDRDAFMIPVRVASTLAWGLALGWTLAAVACRLPSCGEPTSNAPPGRGNERESEGGGRERRGQDSRA